MDTTTKYFIITASRDHVLHAVAQCIAQAGHGRHDYMARLSKGDRVVFYSSKDTFENGKPLQKFTAIGKVTDEAPYQLATTEKFKPYRRNVAYEKVKEQEIRPLLDKLSFIENRKSWGFYFMSGFREISKADFEVIHHAMK